MPINPSVRPEIMDSVALLVIDAQDCFIETLHDKETFLKRTAFAIEAARCLKLHTIFTEQVPDKLGRTNSTLFKLANKPRMFAKTSFSALNAPGMERFLRDNEIYHLLIVGLETPICIYQTGLQATEEDVDVTFLTDALGSRRPEDTAPVLDTLTRMGCQALPSEAVFYSLMGETSSPYFRDFNQIVKAFGSADFSIENYLENRPEFAEIEAPKKERPEREQRDNRRDNNKSERPRRERRDENSEDKESTQEDRPERDNRRDNNRSEDGEERRQHKRGRRRRGGRNRNREERDGPREDRRESEKPAAPKPEQISKPTEAKAPAAPKKESPKQVEAKPVKTEKSEVTEKPATAKKAPAKKVAKKATKKVAKKAVKKVVRKTAKKVTKSIKKSVPSEKA